MARITVEDCLRAENNRFALVQLASKRTKQLLHGSKTVIEDPRANKAVVTALREIASGKVRFMTPDEALAAEQKEAEEARAMAEQEAAAAVGDISIADLLFKTPATLAEEARLGDEDGDDGSEDEIDEAEEDEDDEDLGDGDMSEADEIDAVLDGDYEAKPREEESATASEVSAAAEEAQPEEDAPDSPAGEDGDDEPKDPGESF